MGRSLVNEMQVEPVELEKKLVESIDSGLGRTPVESLAPITHEVLEIGNIHPIGPIGIVEIGRPSGGIEPMPQLRDGSIRNGKRERLDGRQGRYTEGRKCEGGCGRKIDFTSVKPCSPSIPPSRPIPDILNPP